MYRHSNTISYIIFGLIAIGLLANIRNLFIPLVIFGIIFYLYKFPPKQFQRGQSNSRTHTKTRPKPNARKFRVIKGNKKEDDHNENEPPKYH